MDAGATIDPPRAVSQAVNNLPMDDVDLLARHQVGQKTVLRAACFLICPREFMAKPCTAPASIAADFNRKAGAAVALCTRAFVALGRKVTKAACKTIGAANPLGRCIGKDDALGLRL